MPHYSLSGSLLLLALQATAQNHQRPNILYIMSDDHAYQCISAYGSKVFRQTPTPNIDRIARERHSLANCCNKLVIRPQ